MLKIARKGRSFSDGEFIKECLTTSAELLCPNEGQQFRDITLSRNTITRRIQEMAADVTQQLAAASRGFIAYSLALDESTDVTGTPQIVIFVRGVNEKLSIIEEVLDFCPLRDHDRSGYPVVRGESGRQYGVGLVETGVCDNRWCSSNDWRSQWIRRPPPKWFKRSSSSS